MILYLLMLINFSQLKVIKKSIIINIGNIGKEVLTTDTQLTFTCFLKQFFFAVALILGIGGSIFKGQISKCCLQIDIRIRKNNMKS